MMSPPVIENEDERLAALRSLAILDTPAEAEFDELVELAAWTCHVPIAAISLVDESRQWFKSMVGLGVEATARDVALCAHTIQSSETMIVPDTHLDPRFEDGELVVNDPNIRFYAGVPLMIDGPHSVGTLCVIDSRPRAMFSDERRALEIIARQVQSRLLAQRLEWRALDKLTGLSTGSAVSRWMTCQSTKVARAAVHFEISGLRLLPSAAADAAVCSVADVLAGVAAADALIARVDQREFVVLLANRSDDELQVLTARLRAALDALGSAVQVSMGLAAAPTSSSGHDLIDAARRATTLEKHLRHAG